MRLQRGYVLLLAGSIIVVTGIAASVHYAGEFLAEIQSAGVHTIAPRGTVQVSQEISGTQGAYFIAFPRYEEMQVKVQARVLDPSGNTVVQREIDLPFYSEQFAITREGSYTMTISNPSDRELDVSVVIGNPEIITDIVGMSTVMSSAAATFVVIGGIAILVVGGAMIILDKRRAQKMRYYDDLSDLK